MKRAGSYKSRCWITLSAGIRLAADRDILVSKEIATIVPRPCRNRR